MKVKKALIQILTTPSILFTSSYFCTSMYHNHNVSTILQPFLLSSNFNEPLCWDMEMQGAHSARSGFLQWTSVAIYEAYGCSQDNVFKDTK